MRLRLAVVALVALVAAGAAEAKTSVTQQTGRAVATSLDFACAQNKNGRMRWVSNLSECRKKETGVTIAPPPAAATLVCYQSDGSTRKVADISFCPSPGTMISLPPLNSPEYFCAVNSNDKKLTHVGGPSQCGGDTELVSNPTNHAPTDIALTPANVDENVAIGTVVGDLTSSDTDLPSDTHTYTFVDDAGHPDNLKFTIDNSVTPRKLKTNALINFEAQPSYSIKVRTTDAGTLFFEKQLTVTVNDINEPPIADNETYNGSNSAVGNTTFVGDDPSDGPPATPDPTDTSPGTTRPHKTISADILQGDADPEGAAVSVVPGTVTTTDGGTVTLEADGDFVFEPKASTSCTDHQDSFTYTITDGTLTGTGTVTIDIAGCVWYVNNNDAQGNSGTSQKPYDTLAQAETSSATGDSIFVYKGDGTTTGQTAGIDLKASQKLVGEAATLTVGSDTLQTGDAAKRPLITDTASNVVNLAAGNEVRGVQLDPQGGGGISGGAGDASGTIADVRIIDTGTAGTAGGLDLNGTSGTYNVSDLVVDTSGATAPTSADIGVRLNSAGTVNFASASTISITTVGAKGLDAVSTDMGSGSVFDDITVTGSGSGGVNLTSTTGTTNLGDGSGTDLALTTTSGATPAFNLSSAGTVTVDSGGTDNVSATGGPAIDVTGTSGATLDFDDVDSTSSASDGINIDGLGTGTFTAQTGDITGAAGIAFDLNGGSGTVTYPGNLNNGTGATADITGRTGGTVTLSGPINDTNDTGGGITVSGNSGGSTVFSNGTKTVNTGSANAIALSSNSGHTITFSNGGLDVDSTSGSAMSATGGGTVNVAGSGNSLTSTTGTALTVTSTTIGASDLNFVSISANGATNGIVLNNTGSTGGLTVAGGGNTTQGGDASGGTIQSTTGIGVSLTSTMDVSLNNMKITNTPNAAGIDGTDITNFSFTYGEISNNGSTSHGPRDSNIAFDNIPTTTNNVDGTVTITNNKLLTAYVSGVSIANDAGTIADLNVSDNLIQSPTVNSTGSGILLQIVSNTTGSAAQLTKAELNHNTVVNFPHGNGIRTAGGNTSGASAAPTTLGTSAVNNVQINNNSINGASTAVPMDPHFILVDVAGYGTGFVDVSGNGSASSPTASALTNVKGIGISINSTGAATLTVTANNNVVSPGSGQLAGAPGISGGADKQVLPGPFTADSATMNLTLTSNTITNQTGQGIYFLANSQATLNAKILNNSAGQPTDPSPATRPSIRVDSGSSAGAAVDTKVCLQISGNTAVPVGTFFDGIAIRKQGAVTTTNDFGIVGLSPSPATDSQVESKLRTDNPAETLGMTGGSQISSHGASAAYTSCTLPF